MRRIGWLLWIVVVCAGCAGENRELNRAMELRQSLLSADGCSFRLEITADYGQELYAFTLDCRGDNLGNVAFQVLQPETIAGITGQIRDRGGQLTFDDTALAFSLMADGQLTPVSCGWILLKTLRSGEISAVCMENDLLRITAEDSYEDKALLLDIWVDGENRPVRTDILYDGKRILSAAVTDFTLL